MSSRLFSPISLSEIELRNRIIVAPMCQYSAVDGSATDWHLMHLGQFAVSGVGLSLLKQLALAQKGASRRGVWVYGQMKIRQPLAAW